eukprot:762521-Hanusia_phi.AAC.20
MVSKAPLEDYERNLMVLIGALKSVKGRVLWRTGEALHDMTLDAYGRQRRNVAVDVISGVGTSAKGQEDT